MKKALLFIILTLSYTFLAAQTARDVLDKTAALCANGAVQVDNVDVPAFSGVIIPGDVGKFRGNLQGLPNRIPEVLLARHRHAAFAHF